MDLPASPETTTLEHSQSTSTPTVSAPRSRINDLLVSPLTADPTIDISTGGSSVLLESSLEDVSEEQLLNKFVFEGCGCKFGPKSSQCCHFLETSVMSKCRQDCLQLDSNELDLVVLSCIQSHLSLSDQATQCSSHHDTGFDSQKRSEFFVCGVRVCRATFLFVHALSHSRYERLVQHYKHVGLSSRLHGNKGRIPPNTLDFDGYATYHFHSQLCTSSWYASTRKGAWPS